ARGGRGVGDLLAACVIDVPVAVEHDRLDVERDQLGADRLADLARALLLLLAGELGLERRLELAGARQHAAGRVVDRLRVDVARRAKHREPGPLGGAGHPQTDRDLATDSLALLVVHVLDWASHGAFLLIEVIAAVLYAATCTIMRSGLLARGLACLALDRLR